jgi:hypothetical protein
MFFRARADGRTGAGLPGTFRRRRLGARHGHADQCDPRNERHRAGQPGCSGAARAAGARADVGRRQGRRGDLGDAGAGAGRRHRADGEIQRRPSGGLRRREGALQRPGITDMRPTSCAWTGSRPASPSSRCAGRTSRRPADEIGEDISTYVIRREPDGRLAIRAAVMHGEAETH